MTPTDRFTAQPAAPAPETAVPDAAAPKVLVIVVTYHFERWMDRCLGSLRQSHLPVDTVVIDNASTDHTIPWIAERYPEVRLIANTDNRGFGQANNQGLRIARDEGYDFAFLLNQDAWVDPDTIGTLVDLSRKHPDYGILSPVHLNGRGDQLDGGFAHYAGIERREQLPTAELTEVNFVNAAFWMIPVRVLHTVGGFSPLFYHYGEDVDYLHRVHYHGWKVGYAPIFGYHDRELRTVTKPMEYRARCVYLLTAYANPNHSFGKAFVKAIGGGCEQAVKAIGRGEGKDVAVYLRYTTRLLLQSLHIYRARKQSRQPDGSFL